MRPKLIKINKVELIPAQYDGNNGSGCTPIFNKVVVKTDTIPEQTSGGIHMMEDMRERMDLSVNTGVVVEVGESAFKGMPGAPVAGDRIVMEKYAGELLYTSDGGVYRLVEDKSIGGIMKKEPAHV